MNKPRTRQVVETVVRDARYALRVLRKSPLFTVTAVLTLGLAIAVNTAIFSVVDAVLLKPLPYPEPDRLALLTTATHAGGAVRADIAQDGATWEMLRDHASTLVPAVYSSWPTGINVVANGRASYVQQQRVGAAFFDVLGVRPLIGREFSAEEDRAGGPAATILSYRLWRSLFNGDPAAVGTTLMLRGQPATIVGVMPEGTQTAVAADLWTPLRASTAGEGAEANYTILARVRPAVAWAQAEAEARQIGAEAARKRTLPEGTSQSFGLQPLQQGMTTELRQPLLMLWAAVAIVLLVASVNLAGLLLARASARTREIATRMALGSGRAAVIRQLLVESLVLAALGAVTGIALGYVALEGLKSLAEQAFDIRQPIALDGRAVAVACGLAAVASAVFGVAPALQATRLNIQGALIEAGARAIAGGASRWPRRLLVVAQVALGVVLLVGAGLLLRTFAHLRNLEPGFDPAGIVTASVSLDDARYATSARVTQMFDEALSQIRQSPGVDAAAVALGLPYERLLNLGFRHLDGPDAGAKGRMTSATYVSADFFLALRIPLRSGRTFDERDRTDSAGVVVVSETFAKQYFNGADPIGRRIAFAGREREIVGVVGDVQVRPGWGDNGPLAAMPLAYIPIAQASDGMLRLVHGWFSPAFIVRSPGSTDATISVVRRAVDATDPLLPFARIRAMVDVQSASLARERLLMVLLGGLAVSAVLLAAVGIHGLIATSVTERTREMGIRMALGATTPQAMRSLAMPGVLLALAGTAAGALAALALARLLRHFLWGVGATDPLTFGGVAAVLMTVATIASLAPALRILKLDPAQTLRTDQ